jgi:adenylate cyclase, class 2
MANEYEVELKFPVADMTVVAQQIEAMGATISSPIEERDLYFAHPNRDFVETDEALRLRRKGDVSLITYKGPKLDATTKTRREIELPLGSAATTVADWTALLEVLGFSPVAEVRKSRRKAMVPWEGRRVEVSLDDVDRVGTFGELELVTEADGIEAAKACLLSLARFLGLSASERRSYLELLLERKV